MVNALLCFWDCSVRHRVVALRCPKAFEGATADDAFCGKPTALDQPMTGDGFVAVLRACGNVATAMANETGQSELVKPDQTRAKKT